ncbi:MAG: Helix-turn-helix domain [Firmicutes bacterium]|nr:Helix-turn-helix domain [Bacillota bacterium]
MTIGDILLRIRKEKDLSQEELAKLSGVTQGRISQIEKGLTAYPTALTLQRLASALNVSMDIFYEDKASDLIETAEQMELDDEQKKAMDKFKNMSTADQQKEIEYAMKVYKQIKSLPVEDQETLEKVIKAFVANVQK